jgi:hypothetical protein
MDTDTLEEQLKQLLPKSLDDIIRTNRDKVQLYFSRDDEIEALRRPLLDGQIKAQVSDWAFITLHFSESQDSLTYLVGFNQTAHCGWMTSFVTGIGHGMVTTKSGSIYELVGASTQDVDLVHICATLHKWGVGQSLVVPHIFY